MKSLGSPLRLLRATLTDSLPEFGVTVNALLVVLPADIVTVLVVELSESVPPIIVIVAVISDGAPCATLTTNVLERVCSGSMVNGKGAPGLFSNLNLSQRVEPLKDTTWQTAQSDCDLNATCCQRVEPLKDTTWQTAQTVAT